MHDSNTEQYKRDIGVTKKVAKVANKMFTSKTYHTLRPKSYHNEINYDTRPFGNVVNISGFIYHIRYMVSSEHQLRCARIKTAEGMCFLPTLLNYSTAVV